jgi:hypothetical protein
LHAFVTSIIHGGIGSASCPVQLAPPPRPGKRLRHTLKMKEGWVPTS